MHGEEEVLDIMTYLAGLGLLMLYGGISNIQTLRACKMETVGIFVRFQSVLGLPAFFEYEIGGRKYRGLSQSCNIEKYRNVFYTRGMLSDICERKKAGAVCGGKKDRTSGYFNDSAGAGMCLRVAGFYCT